MVKILPSTIYVGMPKSGSTWLFNLLKSHPDCFVSNAKDIYYFDKYYHKGINWYSSFFKGSKKDQVVVDISHDYAISEDAPKRIRKTIPNAKIIFCFRNPILKEYSAYQFGRRNGGNNFSFREGIETGKLDPSKCMYSKYLKNYLKEFPVDQIRVLFFEDLEDNPKKFAKSIFEFIEVDPLNKYDYERKFLPMSKARNKTIAKIVKKASHFTREIGMPQVVGIIKGNWFINKCLYSEMIDRKHITKADYEYLLEYFIDDIIELESLTERDLSEWKQYNSK